MSELIIKQLSSLNIANNIIYLLIELLNKNTIIKDIYMEEIDETDMDIILEVLRHISIISIKNVENKDETIKILKYYLKISRPTRNCYRLLNNIINSDEYNKNNFNITNRDIDNKYVCILYYLVHANLIGKI